MPEQNKFKKLLSIQIVLYLVSIALSVYLIRHHYQLVNGDVVQSVCSINSTLDCESVNASRYAEILGIPTAVWGLSYYLIALILCIVALKNQFWRREALLGLMPLSAAGAVITLFMTYLMVFVLKKVCLFCSALHVLDLATFALSLCIWKSADFNGNIFSECGNSKPKRFAIFAALGITALLGTHFISSQLKISGPSEPFGNYEQNFVQEFSMTPTVIPGGYIETDHSPRLGAEGATPPVQVVEFADFQCPACGYASKRMSYLLQAFGDKVQLVFKHYPLDSLCNPNMKNRMHAHACFAAKAAVCAGKQGKFDRVYKTFFQKQNELSESNIRTWVAEMGIDQASFESCLQDPTTQTLIQKDIALGTSLNIQSTPTFFVNGKKIEGALDYDRMRMIIKVLNK